MSMLRFLLACVCLHVGVAAAEPGRWNALSGTLFTHYKSPAASGATALTQDASGYLWIGTESGLFRWDGYVFRGFPADPETPGALADNYIQALHVDTGGRLWVGTNAGGLYRFDAARDSFVNFAVGPRGTTGRSVRAIVDDGEGGLWIGSHDGLAHLDANAGVRPAGESPTGLEVGINAMLRDRSGTLWVGTRRGLFRRLAGTSALTAVPLDTADDAQFTVMHLFEDGAGRVWGGTLGRGAFVVDHGAAAARAVVGGSDAASLGSESVMSITEAVEGEIWLSTDTGGIVVVSADGGTRRIRRQVGVATGLANDDDTVLFRDRSGIVWLATTGTLSRRDPRQQAVLALPGESTRPGALRARNVDSVLARPDGTVWLGVGSEGVDIVDALRGRVGQLVSDGAHPQSALPRARVDQMVASPQGDVFIATESGLYLADADGRAVQRLEIPGRDPVGTVASLCQDGAVLWLGGSGGLWALDTTDRRHLRVLRHDAMSAVGGELPTVLQRGSGNDLWIGTRHGLLRVDTADAGIERIGGDKADRKRFPVGVVSSMLMDARGRLWVSAYGDGLWLIERPSPGGPLTFRRLGRKEGLPDAGVDKLLADGDGRVWVSTDDGLAVVDPETLAIRSLRRPEGVDILTYWMGSGDATPAGELLFGGQGGVSVVRPDRLATWAFRPPVVVTEARIDDTIIPSGRLDPTLGPVVPLKVAPTAHRIAIEFAALDFSAPEQNRYAYRLRGFDAGWITTDATRRTASYTGLAPGDYTLEIRGSNRDGAWSDPPLALPIRVLPAWYQTVAFRLTGLCAGLIVVAGLVQARTSLLRRRQRKLETLIALRTQELRETQRELEKIAYADPLTHLPNRRWFTDELDHQIAQARRSGPLFTLLLIDLDGFKGVNDMHGHDAGDALLATAASRLLAAVRESDRVARMGGDEFAVLLTQQPTTESVDLVCQRIVSGLGEPVSFKGVTLRAGASIGVAPCADDESADHIYKAADLALYAAKRAGRNTWRWHGRRPCGEESFPPGRRPASG